MIVTVQVLGPPRFFVEGEEITFPFRKVQALACLLFLEGKISRDRLAGLFWGDKSDATAAANLRNALYQLRKILPPETVEVDRQWVLRGENVRLDVEMLQSGDRPSMERALCPLMEGFVLPEAEAFEEWLCQARQYWLRTGREILFAQALRSREEGKIVEAGGILRALNRFDPLDEQCARLLMECVSAQGERGQLSTIYQALTRELAGELGVRPEESTTKLYHQLLMQETKKKENSWGTKSFWGREEECWKIRSFLEKDGEMSHVVLLSGEPGVGKSLLLDHVVEGEKAQAPLIFRGSAAQLEDRYPLFPWNDLLRSFMNQMDMEGLDFPPASWSFLGASFPSLGVTYRGSSIQPQSPVAIGPVLASLFSLVSDGRRVLLLMEDLQWYDQASLDLLESFLLHHPGQISLLLSVRENASEGVDLLLRRLARQGRLDLLSLKIQPFNREEADAFCQFLCPHRTFTNVEREAIYKRTEGLPLFIVELLRGSCSHPLDILPEENLSDLVEEHLAELSGQERAVIEILSVFSVRGEWDLLLPLSGLSPLELTGVVESLKRNSLIREHLEREDDLRFEFCHTMVREHVYFGLSGTRRRLLHGEVARLLSGWMRSGRWDGLLCSRVIRHCQLAGAVEKEFLFSVLALKEHIVLNYELFPLRSDDELRHSATSFASREQTEQRLDEIRDLAVQLRQRGNRSLELDRANRLFLCIRGGYHLWWGDYRLGLELVKKALSMAQESEDLTTQLECIRHLCYRAIQVEDGDLLAAHSKCLVDLATKHGREPEKAMGVRFLGIADLFRQNYVEAEQNFMRSYDLFQFIAEMDERYSYQEVAALGFTAESHHRRGDLVQASDLYERCLRSCEENGFFRGCGLFHSALAHVAFDMRDEGRMFAHLERALEILRRAENWRGDSVVYSLAALMWWRRGMEEEALECLKKADSICLALEKGYWIALQNIVKWRLKQDVSPGSTLGCFLKDDAADYLERARFFYRGLGLSYKLKLLEAEFRSSL